MSVQFEFISINKLSSVLDFIYIRNLRNANKNLMTSFQNEVTILRQLIFALKYLFSNDVIYILKYNNIRAGFIYLRKYNDGHLLTIIISDNYRSKGIGDYFLKFIIKRYKIIYSFILLNNFKSINLHMRNNFVMFEKNTNNLCFVHKN